MENRNLVLTKKELNAMLSAAYEAFLSNHEKDFAPGASILMAYRITEGTMRKIVLVDSPTQMHSAFLSTMGFSNNAKVELLFTADRSLKQIHFTGI